MRSPRPFPVRFFAWAARLLLPTELVRDHGEELVRSFADLWVAARRRGGGAPLRLLAFETAGLLHTVYRERLAARARRRRGAAQGELLFGDVPWDGFETVSRTVRVLVRHGGSSGFVILVLAVGVAATVATFTVVHGVLDRPLPYADADRLVMVWSEVDGDTGPTATTVAPADFIAYRSGARVFAGMEAHNVWLPVISGGVGDAERVLAGMVTPGFFDLMGVRPLLGRTFRPDEATAGASVVILSHGLWQSRYGGDPAILGKDVRVDGRPYQVVGVLPPGYRHPDPHRPLDETVLFVPFDTSGWPTRLGKFLRVVGRLAPGVTAALADQTLDGVVAGLRAEGLRDPTEAGVRVVPLREEFYGSSERPLGLVALGVGLLYLIVCVNVANVVLARVLSRRQEFAVRASLGAGRDRLMRQLLLENGLLSFGGTGLGVGIVALAMNLIRGVQGRFLPRIGDIRLDPAVLLTAVGLAVATTLLLGALPLLELRGVSMRSILSEETAGGGGSRASRRIRSGLVVLQLALATALVVGAGLLGRSFSRLAGVSPGFDADRVFTAELSIPLGVLDAPEEREAFYGAVRERLAALPGARTVGYASQLPMLDGDWSREFQPADRTEVPEEAVVTEIRYVSPDYFSAMGVPVLEGRSFSPADASGGSPAVVVNRLAARRLWPDGRALGRDLSWVSTEEDGTQTRVTGHVIGVVADVLDDGLGRPPDPFVYFRFGPMTDREAAFIVRGDGDLRRLDQPVRRMVADLAPDVLVGGIGVYADRLRGTLAVPRFASLLAATFSVLSLVLAALGVYGVLAYAVGARTREIGIRTALGARGADVRNLVLRDSLALATGGALLGLAGALVATRALRALLFEVSAHDPLTLVAAPLVLMGVALAASWLPARRAIRVDPATTLREGASR